MQARIRRMLNPLFADHSTGDGLPKPLNAEPVDQEDVPAPKPNTFEYFLAEYNKKHKSHHFSVDLLLILFLIEYKKVGDDNGHKATNQARTHAAAVLEFFKTLGIHNQPVYLFVTDGNQGALSMAMSSQDTEADEVCIIVHVFVSVLTARVDRDNPSLWSGMYASMILETLATPTSCPFSCKRLQAEPKNCRRSS